MRSLILNECLVVPVLQFNVLMVAYYSLPSIKGSVTVATSKTKGEVHVDSAFEFPICIIQTHRDLGSYP